MVAGLKSCGRRGELRYPVQREDTCVSFERAALNELVAQLVEQRPFKAWVLGSSPSELTTPPGRRLPPHFRDRVKDSMPLSALPQAPTAA